MLHHLPFDAGSLTGAAGIFGAVIAVSVGLFVAVEGVGFTKHK